MGAVSESRAAGDDLLPPFVVADEDGLWVDLARLENGADFAVWAEGLFVRGAYFRELDYSVFQRLSFECEPGRVADLVRSCEGAGRAARVRFAAGIAHILPLRIPLYRGLKLLGGKADYLFEPVTLEIPVAGGGGEEGAGGGGRMLGQPTRLDFDEFVAQMWLKGLHFGIDESAVRKAMGEGYVGSVTIARARAPAAGMDAGVEELSAGLHRDDAPDLLPDGRVNLAQFRNRFPQIRAGTRLLRKRPLQPGEPGRELDGRPVAPPLRKDLDFTALAGAGTRVERSAEGEILVAVADGFLDIDPASGRVSVTEKIINRVGVSLRTTGDLVLMGDEYEEHGEIQEGRMVEGLNVTTFADVFGKIVSRGGAVTLKRNLAGGAIVNPAGAVSVEGRVSGATILAPGGEVVLHHAENSLIVGRRVTVQERAIGCDILADEVRIAQVEASVIAAAAVSVDVLQSHGSAESLVTVMLPPDDGKDELLQSARSQLDALQAADLQAKERMESLRARPGVGNYLTVASRVHKQELNLTEEQTAAFHRLRDSIAPILKEMAQLSEQGKARSSDREKLLAAIAAVDTARVEAGKAVSCHIATIGGDLIVRTRRLAVDARRPDTLPPGELKAFLRATGDGNPPLFAGEGGSFDWSLAGAGRRDG